MAYAPAVSEPDALENERRTARLVAAGAVGASVAHELRNALAVAESALYLAQRDLDDRARLTRHLDQVGAEIRKAHHVIGSVLGLARGEPVHRETAPVRRLVDTARHALTLPSYVTFEIAVEPEDLTVLCDPILPGAGLLQPLPQRHRGPGRPGPRRHRHPRLARRRAHVPRGRGQRPGPRSGHRRPHLRAPRHLQDRRHRARPGDPAAPSSRPTAGRSPPPRGGTGGRRSGCGCRTDEVDAAAARRGTGRRPSLSVGINGRWR